MNELYAWGFSFSPKINKDCLAKQHLTMQFVTKKCFFFCNVKCFSLTITYNPLWHGKYLHIKELLENLILLVFRYFLSKCFDIGLQEKGELINVSTTLQAKEIKKGNSVFKCPMLPEEMPCNSFASKPEL
jgi:hypothetical protein